MKKRWTPSYHPRRVWYHCLPQMQKNLWLISSGARYVKKQKQRTSRKRLFLLRIYAELNANSLNPPIKQDRVSLAEEIMQSVRTQIDHFIHGQVITISLQHWLHSFFDKNIKPLTIFNKNWQKDMLSFY